MTEPQSDGTASCKAATKPTTGTDRMALSARYLSFALLVAMLVTIFLLLQYPLHRINSDAEINFNEGWNAYRQAFAREGKPLYGAAPDLVTGATNYPPISFHVVALLSFHDDVVTTARWVSLLSLLATAAFIGLVVGELGADTIGAMFAALLYVLAIAVFLPDRLGMDDPQLLAEAITTAGLYLYVKSRGNVALELGLAKGPNLGLLAASAVAFCLALFTKQNLVAFPAAVAVDLIVSSRRCFAIWCGAMLASAAALLGLTLALDGRYFFQHLLGHRAYSLDTGLASISHYLFTFQGVLLVVLVWILCRFRAQPLLALAFVFSNGLAFVLAGGDGVDLNIFFNAIAAAVMICGVASVEIAGRLTHPRLSDEWPDGTVGAPLSLALFREKVGPALMLALFLCVAIRVPDRLREGHLRQHYLAEDDTGFRAAVELLKTTPGPALCESLLLCYRAGEPYDFDTYTAIEEIKSHHTDEDASLPLLRSRHFAVIQLDAMPGEALNDPPTIYRQRSRFTAAFVDTLLQNYRLALRTSHMLLFVRKSS